MHFVTLETRHIRTLGEIGLWIAEVKTQSCKKEKKPSLLKWIGKACFHRQAERKKTTICKRDRLLWYKNKFCYVLVHLSLTVFLVFHLGLGIYLSVMCWCSFCRYFFLFSPTVQQQLWPHRTGGRGFSENEAGFISEANEKGFVVLISHFVCISWP